MNAGVYDEASAWRDWLLRAVAGNPADMQIMYGIMGERRLTEWEVGLAAGLSRLQAGADRQCRARPVPARRLRRADGHLRAGAQGRACRHGERLGPAGRADEARRPRLGRARLRHLGDARPAAPLHLFQGDGVGGVRSRDQGGRRGTGCPVRSRNGAPRAPGSAPRSASTASIAERNTFRSAYGETTLDASLLLLGQVGFIKPNDPRYIGTIEAIEREPAGRRLRQALRHRRNRRRAGARRRRLPRLQLLAGRRLRFGRAARRCARRCSSACCRSATISACWPRNTTPRSGRLIGNFPQAFSHVGLINTAFNLTRASPPRRAARQGQGRRGRPDAEGAQRRRSGPARATKWPSRARATSTAQVRRREPSSEAR